MNKNQCLSNRKTTHTLGGILLSFAVVIAFIGSYFLPIVLLLFAFPLLLGSLQLITAPESKACRLIT